MLQPLQDLGQYMKQINKDVSSVRALIAGFASRPPFVQEPGS